METTVHLGDKSVSMNQAEKQAIISEVAEIAAGASSAIAAEYRGLNVTQLTQLRAKARESGIYLRVVKNTLAQRAVQGTTFECLIPSLTGPIILAFSRHEPGTVARLFRDFIKEKSNDKLIIKALVLGSKLLPTAELEFLANLPNRTQAICMLMACIRSPLNKLSMTFKDIPSKLVRIMIAIQQQKTAV